MLNSLNSNTTNSEEEPCYFYIDAEPLNSYREVLNKIMSKDIEDKEAALKTMLGSITNDDTHPDNLMISIIHNISIVDDIRVKKLLFLFWEVIEKTQSNGKIREEFILVCNSLRKDLIHPNEYVRGRTLRLLTKLPYVEILESLKTVVFENLSHHHSYVRSNALMCVISFVNNFGLDVLPDTIVEKLQDLILKDSDVATKRNAYLLLSKINPKESLLITKEILTSNEINELADLFALTIVENLKNLCNQLPREKSKFIKMLMELSNHKSHSVLFEIGSSLISLSSNPNTVRNAVNILCNLLVEQKDNNTLIIILRKLMEIKNKYRDILEEQILSFAIILDSSTTTELRKLLFELISELIKESNIARVFEIFISDFNKLKNVSETESTLEFKNMILNCMHRNIKKLPNLNRSFPLFLLEKCLLYDSKNTFLDTQILIVKDLFFIYESNPSNLEEFVNKIILCFEDISSSEILQTCIWILAEYTNDVKTIKKVFDLIMKNMGDLNLELNTEVANNSVNKNTSNNSTTNSSEKKVITKTVILPDGTYGTQTIVIDPTEYNKQKETKFLRKFLLETNFYFATNLVVALTRMVINMYYLELEKEATNSNDVFKTYFYNTVNIICAVLKINSEKIFKDPDNITRISMCLEFLISGEFDKFRQFIKESKEIYNEYYSHQLSSGNLNSTKSEKRVTQVDEFISFRHVKPYDPDNFDNVDDENVNTNANSQYDLEKAKLEENTKKKNKFIEVLTGSDDPLHIEAVVEIFTFDIVIEFFIKNITKQDFQNVTIDLFAPTNLDIIEKAPQISLSGNEAKTVRSCIKFSSTCNSYIFGQVTYANNKGALNSLNLSGIFIDLLNTYPADISESNFRKCWVEYNWEHNVILISKKTLFREIIENLVSELNLKLVVPKDSSLIDEDSVFLVANLYTKSKLGEDALINVSIEKTLDKRIIGTAVIRSKVKEFTILLGDKIKALIK